MIQYHKINSVYMRDEKGNHIPGLWARPEFDYLQYNKWEFTEKVDGTNIRVMFDGTNVTFGGKTDNAQIPSKLVTVLYDMFPEKMMGDVFGRDFDTLVCLYGEGYGAKIQKAGGNYHPDQSFVLFDVKIGKWWLRREDVDALAKTLGICSVPIIGTGTLQEGIYRVMNGITSAWGDFEAEGIVARPVVEMFDRAGNRIITKIKHKDFRR